jgi:anhydro-N-acetylmuramic acid kinase
MKKWIRKLNSIAEQQERTILGLMSGTSMDGIDMALCRVHGASMSTKVDVLKQTSVPVEEDLQKTFYELAYKPDAATGEVLRLNSRLSEAWCERITEQLKIWNMTSVDIDLIGSHGQTLFHQPDPDGNYNATLQIVDGDILAQKLGLITVSDFRQKHIAAGYEGAPLAPLGEVLLFSDIGKDRILLNLGGIANFTILKAGTNTPVVPFATDTGPANTLLDEAVKHLLPGKKYDENGRTASSGKVNRNLLNALLDHPFFDRAFPKSTGQEDFHWKWVYKSLLKTEPELQVHDLLSTLTELTAVSVSDAIKKNLKEKEAFVYVSGGGWKNSYLIKRLKAHLPGFEIQPSSGLGLDPEFKEAALFAVLANELVAGEGWINRKGECFALGKISLPG